jgi:hypothetical protein
VPVYVAAESYKFARCGFAFLYACMGWWAGEQGGGGCRAGNACAVPWEKRLKGDIASRITSSGRGVLLQSRPYRAVPALHVYCRLYPLNQRDLPVERKQLDFGPLLPASVAIDNPSRDYTPPQVRCQAAWLGVRGAGGYRLC